MTSMPAGQAARKPDESSTMNEKTAQDRPFIWIDGKMLPKSQAMVSVFDHGFLYGDGCFEGIRVYKGVIFKCDSHLRRIYRNAEKLRMEMPYSVDQMREIMEECVRANELDDGYIRLIFSRGVGTLGLHPFQCPTPTVVCIADQISLYPEEMYQEGMKVIVADRPRTPTACLDPSLK